VIGNPPYLKEANNKDLFEDLRRASIRKYCIGKMDLWYAFACMSLDLVRPDGYHSFIATNNWITNAGATILRRKFYSEAKFIQFVDFADFHVFQDASIQTMIYIAQKKSINQTYELNYFKVASRNVELFSLVSSLEHPGDERNGWIESKIDPTKIDQPFTLTSSSIKAVLEKIESIGTFHLEENEIGNGIDVLQDFVTKNHLAKLKVVINPGDGVFVLSDIEKNHVVESENDSSKIKPYYTSSEIDRYKADDRNKYWLIYADREVRENIKHYPGIRKHLSKFTPILTSAFAPYGLHRPRDERFFIGEKILSLRKTRHGCFSLVTFPCYVSRAFLVIKPNRQEISLSFLLGILNSKLANYWLFYRGKKQGDQLQVDKEPLLRFPFYPLNMVDKKDMDLKQRIVVLVDRMLDLHKQTPATPQEKEQLQRQIAATDRQIDTLVYQLYGLTDEEIALVESS
jgi:adenine-specific DNA-methyltransferase